MVGEDVLIPVIGLIIFLTGLMHIFGGFRTGPVGNTSFSVTHRDVVMDSLC